MPETNWAKLDYRQGLPRAETRQVGSGWADAPSNDRLDATTHFPLSVLPDAAPSQPEAPPPPPTEDQLRATLHECLMARDFANDQLERARGTASRAAAYVTQCRERLESFAGLEDDAAAAIIEALRCGAGRLDPDDDVMRRKRLEREIARDALHAAGRVASVLDAALLDATADADAASKAARAAATAVAGLEAQRLAEHVVGLEDLAGREREVLVAFDRISAGTGQALPASVFSVVLGDARLAKPVDTIAWDRAVNDLLVDAQAQIEIEIPARRPVPPVLRYSPAVVDVVPLRPLQPAAEEGAVTEIPDSTVED